MFRTEQGCLVGDQERCDHSWDGAARSISDVDRLADFHAVLPIATARQRIHPVGFLSPRTFHGIDANSIDIDSGSMPLELCLEASGHLRAEKSGLDAEHDDAVNRVVAGRGEGVLRQKQKRFTTTSECFGERIADFDGVIEARCRIAVIGVTVDAGLQGHSVAVDDPFREHALFVQWPGRERLG